MPAIRRVNVKSPLVLVAPGGAEFMVAPSGDGISIVPEVPKTAAPRTPSGGPGRQPAPETLRLRKALEADAAKGNVRPPAHYVTMYQKWRPNASVGTARQIVWRERRAYATAAPKKTRRGKRGADAILGIESRGRKPAPHTVALREKLAKDVETGELREASHYVKWVVDKFDLGIKQARPIVYRELRAHR